MSLIHRLKAIEEHKLVAPFDAAVYETELWARLEQRLIHRHHGKRSAAGWRDLVEVADSVGERAACVIFIRAEQRVVRLDVPPLPAGSTVDDYAAQALA